MKHDAGCQIHVEHEGTCDIRPPVIVDFTNWRGKRRTRKISPVGRIMHMANPPWHPVAEWTIGVIDHQDGKHKFFPLANIHSWTEEQ